MRVEGFDLWVSWDSWVPFTKLRVSDCGRGLWLAHASGFQGLDGGSESLNPDYLNSFLLCKILYLY